MRKLSALLLVLALVLSLAAPVLAAESATVTAPTGYTKAEDVEYITVSGTVVNWGARGEACTFLSTYAQAYYTNNYTWNSLSAAIGGTGTADAPTSALYQALQDMMKAKHAVETSYGDTRSMYRYTDCLRNDYDHISSFYSGKELNGAWDSGKTWNREHTWPNSKGLAGNDENDIMMLRPTWKSENSSRGNTAYGESSGYYDPGAGVRGDCARIVLYVYTRWGNVGKMWGSYGVMENLDVLLKWMEEDPVDTWEMGRNDAVQSITGVRNVFVDYPEFAWLLFGQEIPADLVTPSGNAASQTSCAHKNTEYRNPIEANCTANGYTGDVHCTDCGKLLSEGTQIPASGVHTFGPWTQVEGAPNLQIHSCTVCGLEDARTIPTGQPGTANGWIWVMVAIVGVAAVGAVVFLAIKKKK